MERERKRTERKQHPKNENGGILIERWRCEFHLFLCLPFFRWIFYILMKKGKTYPGWGKEIKHSNYLILIIRSSALNMNEKLSQNREKVNHGEHKKHRKVYRFFASDILCRISDIFTTQHVFPTKCWDFSFLHRNHFPHHHRRAGHGNFHSSQVVACRAKVVQNYWCSAFHSH